MADTDPTSELEEALVDVLNQACTNDQSVAVDSLALSAYADALRLLSRRGRFCIDVEAGRRLIGHFIKKGQ